MSRPPRIHVAGGFYHVTLRGNHRQRIYFTDADHRRFIELVGEAIDRCQWRVHAYCLMPNHCHLAVQVGEIPLGAGIRTIASRYSRRIHRRADTSGHLFERRYHASLVTTDAYLLELVRYIHLNPVRAGFVQDPADHRWSSHRIYLGRGHPGWVTTDTVLTYFSSEPTRARDAYARFLSDATPQRVLEEFRRRAVRPSSDGCVAIQKTNGPPALERIIDTVCSEWGFAPDELIMAGKNRLAADLRRQVTIQARSEGVATLAQIARRLNRSSATLLQQCQRHSRK